METATPLRVALLGETTSAGRSGGLNRYLETLQASLAAVGIEATGVLFGGSGWALDAGPQDAPLRRRLRDYYRATQRLGRQDVLDVHFALYGLSTLIIGRHRHTKVVVHFQGPWADESKAAGGSRFASQVKRLIERLVYRRAAAVVVLSQAFRDIAVGQYGVDPDRVHVIPPAVDTRLFDSTQRIPNPDRFTVVCARRLERRMGIDTLLTAWSSMPAHLSSRSELRIIGTGSELEALRAQAQGLGLHNVAFLGRVSDEDLLDEYSAAHVSVVPSRALEGFGLVAIESLACGTPCIVTDVGGLPDAVKDLQANLIVPPEDSVALRRRLVAASEGDLPNRTQAREHARTFNLPRLAASHSELYQFVSSASVAHSRRPG